MNLVDNIKAVLTADDIGSDAVRLWLWLLLGGKTEIDRVFAAPLPSIVPSLNALVRSKRVEVEGARVLAVTPQAALGDGSGVPSGKSERISPRLSKVHGLERVRRSLANPRLAGAREAIDEGIGRIFRAVNAERKARGVSAMPRSQERGLAAKWRKVLAFTAEQNANIPEFISFAYENTRHLPGKFPTPAVLAGTWIQQSWIDRDDGGRSAHAGHVYTSPEEGLRDRLRKAGHGEAADLDDEGLRHLSKLADTHRTVPHMRKPHRTPALEAAVVWLAEEGL